MYTFSVTVTNLQTERFREASARDFWAGVRNEPGFELNVSDYEARLANRFARNLTQLVQGHILGRRPYSFREREVSQIPDARMSLLLSRIVFTLEDIKYGSLTMTLGLPDIDAFFEALGRNVDVLQAVLGAYIPEAFTSSLGGGEIDERFGFSIKPSPELVERSRQMDKERTTARDEAGKPEEGTGKETVQAKGQRIVAGLLQSAILLPVLIVVFLWWVARQDTLAERQITSGVLQTMVQQQTATISLLKDALVKSSEKPEPKPPVAANTSK